MNQRKHNSITFTPRRLKAKIQWFYDYEHYEYKLDKSYKDYSGVIKKRWFNPNGNLSGEFVFHEIEREFETYHKEVPEIHWYGAHEKDIYVQSKYHKHKKRERKADDSYEEYIDMLEQVYNDSYYYSDTYA